MRKIKIFHNKKELEIKKKLKNLFKIIIIY
jgi:hypothetical protein